jgi:Reverse transcriptase (RNA-dependent DNA polymerase)
MERSRRLRRQGNSKGAEELRSKAQQLPSLMTDDPDYRRLNYVRYADDFLLGFIGPKSEAEAIKQQLRAFLQEQLKLELSEEKTLITHARSEAAKFLGYEITKLHNDEQRTKKKAETGLETMCRTINHVIGLRVPQDVIEAKRQRYMQGQEAVHRAELLERSDYDIVMTYQLE